MATDLTGTSLKDILSSVLGECGFLVPDSFVGSPNPDDVQLVYLANRSASSLNELGLQRVIRQYDFSMTASSDYDLPADFLEYVPDTMFADNQAWPFVIPADPETWAYYQSTNSVSGIQYIARFYDDKLHVLNPQVGLTVTFEYISKWPIYQLKPAESAPAVGASGTSPRFVNDTDLWLLDRDLIVMDLIWRFKKAKGIPDWQIDFGEFKAYKNQVRARDKGAQTITYTSPKRFHDPLVNLWAR